MTDDQRWDSLGIYGDKIVKTPHIDALAREGTRFENAFTVAPLCVPSRTCFFSGKRQSTSKRFGNGYENHIQPGHFSFMEPLKKAGYKIGLSGKNHAFSKAYAKKWFYTFEEFSPWGRFGGNEADKAVKKFRSTSGPKSSLKGKLLDGLIDFPEPFPEEQCMTARIADEAIAFVEKNKKKSFFLHMSFPTPHWPNVICEPYFSMYKDQLDEISLAGMDEIDWDNHPLTS